MTKTTELIGTLDKTYEKISNTDSKALTQESRKNAKNKMH